MSPRPLVRLRVPALVLVALCAVPTSVRGQPGVEADSGLARGSRLVLGLERATGVVGWQTRTEVDNDFGRFERSRRGAQLHLLAASGQVGDGRDAVNFSGIPRVALDFVTAPGLTLGGFAGVLGTTGIETLTIDGAEQPEIPFPDVITVLGGARVGYVLQLSRSVTFWPRLGVAYALQRIYGEAGARQTIQSLQITLEPSFVLSPAPHVGILLQPLLDLGVAGNVSSSFVVSGLPTQSSTGSYRAHGVGATAGLVVYF